MHSTGSGETYRNAYLAERQMLLHDVREKAFPQSPTEKTDLCYRFLTISRVAGSLGDLVAEELARRLGWHVYDKEIVNAIAENSHVRQSFVEELDERSLSLVHDTVQRLLRMAEGDSFGIEEYHEALVKTLAVLAARGSAILVGRGANFALRGGSDGLHVRITADMDVRIQRLSEKWKVASEDARR
jgi:cytidylate kinase